MPIATATYEYVGSFLCPDCEGYYDGDGVTIGRTWGNSAGRVVCPNCAALAGYLQCAGCYEWRNGDEFAEGTDGELYCESCFSEAFITCSGCGCTMRLDDVVTYNYDSYCTDCAPCDDNGQEWDCGTFNGRNNTYERIGSRAFGVEIETSQCEGYAQLENDSDFNAWGVKEDGSISGMEFVSAILNGDRGLAEVENFTRYARNNDWEVNARCGLHVHFDMRNESNDGMKAIVLAYYLSRKFWEGCVDDARLRNHYCHADKLTMAEIAEIDDIYNFADNQPRYTWINYTAYRVHGTFEVRLHHGSLSGKEICAWIIAHERFMAWASRVGFDGVKRALWIKSDSEKKDFILDLAGGEVSEFYS